MAGTTFNALTSTPQSLSNSQTDAVLVRLRNGSGQPVRISRIKKSMNNVTSNEAKVTFKLWIADNGTGTSTTGMVVAGTNATLAAPSSLNLYAGGTKGSSDVCYDVDHLNSFSKDADFPGADGLWLPTSKELVITYSSGTLTGSPTVAINIMGEQ